MLSGRLHPIRFSMLRSRCCDRRRVEMSKTFTRSRDRERENCLVPAAKVLELHSTNARSWMPSDETRRLLKTLGIAVTEYEDAVHSRSSSEEIRRRAAQAREEGLMKSRCAIHTRDAWSESSEKPVKRARDVPADRQARGLRRTNLTSCSKPWRIGARTRVLQEEDSRDYAPINRSPGVERDFEPCR